MNERRMRERVTDRKLLSVEGGRKGGREKGKEIACDDRFCCMLPHQSLRVSFHSLPIFL